MHIVIGTMQAGQRAAGRSNLAPVAAAQGARLSLALATGDAQALPEIDRRCLLTVADA